MMRTKVRNKKKKKKKLILKANFVGGVSQVWNSVFLHLDGLPKPRLKNPVCPIIYYNALQSNSGGAKKHEKGPNIVLVNQIDHWIV